MWAHRTGCVTLNSGDFPEHVRIKKTIPTIADLYQAAGYVTGLVGKWHCGREEGYRPWERGFTHVESFSLAKGMKGFFEFGVRTESGETHYTDRYLTDDIGDRAVAFVRRHRDRPFFLHVAHHAPHRPLQAPAEYINKYKKRGFDEKTATVYAMVEVMDKNIGNLMAELEAQKLFEKTIVVFSSDNGQDPLSVARFNMNFKGTKYTVNEGGIHVPFSLYWKGRAEAAECPETIHFVDVLPTLAGLCGLAVPGNYSIDGRSFAPCLPGFAGARATPDYFWQWNRGIPYYTHNAAVRRGKWKLVRPEVKHTIVTGESAEVPVLYNIEADPSESTDVSAKNKKIYNQLQVVLEQWCRQVEHDRLSR
jgi:arylsulfatase A